MQRLSGAGATRDTRAATPCDSSSPPPRRSSEYATNCRPIDGFGRSDRAACSPISESLAQNYLAVRESGENRGAGELAISPLGDVGHVSPKRFRFNTYLLL